MTKVDDKKKKRDDDDSQDRPPKKHKKRTQDNNDVPQTPPPEPVRILFPFVFHARPNDNDDGDDDEDERSFKAKIKKIKNRIIASNMEEKVKKMALSRLKTVNEFNSCKELEWFESLLKIPFGKYSKLPVSKTDGKEKIEDFFENAYKNLDNAVYGMTKVKEEIINYIAQFISTNGESMPRIIGLVGEAGIGKCLEKGTKVLMYDGHFKKVEDICVGEKIMGDDSTCRTVLALGSGKDQMYKIENEKGESYVVNSEHILTLRYSNTKHLQDCKKDCRYKVKWFNNKTVSINSKSFRYRNKDKEEILKEATSFLKTIIEEKVCDIPIKRYMELPKSLKRYLKGFSVGIDFEHKDLDFDPYILGLWLGDGAHCSTKISNQDSTVLKYLVNNLGKYDCYLQHSSNYDYRINSLNRNNGNYMLNFLRKYDLIKNKHIPHIFKCNSRENRLRLLAGLIDSDGSLTSYGTGYEISQSVEHEKLLDDIKYLCQSLGFSCTKNQKQTSWNYKGEKKRNIALRLTITGNGLHEVPVLVSRKKARERTQIKNALVSGIKVSCEGEGEYYGFMIDGNNRFVIDNFIVTHNTSLLRRGLSETLKRPMKCMSMGGIRDSSHFVGFEFTYSGSKHGCIVQTLIETGFMNPIIFMDELDKISFTNDGLDVQNLLVHLTDPVQNNTFEDKYFSGIEFDLSKAIFIFSFNDINLISPILKDRLHIIEVPTPTEKEKVIIGRKYLIKELSPNIGIKEEDVIFDEEVMRYIITQHCQHDKGVRGLKRCIETILLKINTANFLGRLNKYKTLKSIKFPFTITKEMVDELVEKNKNDKDELIRHLFL